MGRGHWGEVNSLLSSRGGFPLTVDGGRSSLLPSLPSRKGNGLALPELRWKEGSSRKAEWMRAGGRGGSSSAPCSRGESPGFRLCPSQLDSPWLGDFTSLSLTVLICEMGKMLQPISRCCEGSMRQNMGRAGQEAGCVGDPQFLAAVGITSWPEI